MFAVAGVCLSVRLSVLLTLVHCIQTAKDIVKLLSRPASPIILVFDPDRRYPIPGGTPVSGGTKYTGVEIFFAIFDGNLRLSRKRYEIGPCYGTLIEKSWVADRYV